MNVGVFSSMCRRALWAVLIIVAIHNVQAGNIYSLRPRPKAAFERTGQFTFFPITFLVRPINPTAATWAAIEYVQRAVQPLLGDTLLLITTTQYAGGSAVLIGERAGLASRLASVTPLGEHAPEAQGYVIDIAPSTIILAGTDSNGTFNGASTLVQLLNKGAGVQIHCAHIWDAPDFPYRWASTSYNVLNANEFTSLRAMIDTMALRKLNGIQQMDFRFSAPAAFPQAYRDSITLLRSYARQTNVELSPDGVGWQSHILAAYPNYVEGAPVTQTYVVESDTGRAITDARVVMPNGDFESVSNGKFSIGLNAWSAIDGQGTNVFIDSATVHNGRYSARCEKFRTNNPSGSLHFIKRVPCAPRSAYFLSAWIKTLNYAGEHPQLLAVGTDGAGSTRVLTFTNFQLPSTTNGWVNIQVPFNTLTFTTLDLSCVIPSADSGQVWWDDVQVIDAGMTNILRRTGAPLIVHNRRTNTASVEGSDFSAIKDSILNVSAGNYGTSHTPPTLHRMATGTMQNGDTLAVSFYLPLMTNAQIDGSAIAMMCVSEDSLYAILGAQAGRVESLLHPRTWFLSHNDPVALNWDRACSARTTSPAGLYADYINRADSIIRRVHPGATSVVFGDMFDSLQNAVYNYQLVNGDLRGDWDSLSRRVLIANRNVATKEKSLNLFSRHGFNQVACPDVNVGNSLAIESWRRAQDTVKGQRGGIYTTASNDYRFLTAFADYYWSAGPYIVHVPLDTLALSNDTVTFVAAIVPDPNDATDTISVAQVDFLDMAGGVIQSIPLKQGTGNTFSGVFANRSRHGFQYRIVARNREELQRAGIAYIVGNAFAPVLVSPANDSGCVPLDHLISWIDVHGATSYRVQVSKNPTFTNIIVDTSGVTEVSYRVPMEAYDAVYYWRVAARHDSIISPWSPVWHFKTALAAPSLLLPEDATVETDTVVEFFWSVVAGARNYIFQFDTSATFSAARSSRIIPDTFYTQSFVQGRKYYWRVASTDSVSCTVWSQARTLSTKQFPFPAKVVLVGPLNDSIRQSDAASFMALQWHLTASGVDHYEVVLLNFTTFVVDVDSLVADTILRVPVRAGNRYGWYVRAHNEAGWGPRSDTGKFVVVHLSAVDEHALPPAILSLANAPNPFADQTTIAVSVSHSTAARLSVYDMLGRERAIIYSGRLDAGEHAFHLDASLLEPGAYICNVSTPGGTMRRLIMIAR